MSFHHLEFRPKYVENAESYLPPLTLPVMFENENVALAIYEKDRYSFNLPDKIGAQIDFGSLSPAIIFGSTGRGWSRVLSDDDDLLYIVLEPV